MRFDIVSVFPEFFSVLDLSLVGKAQERGILDVQSHDLRDWTDDPHRTVDDTPAGGGAGMVMRPDIWGTAIDSLMESSQGRHGSRTILAIPTPSGVPLTQRTCERLAQEASQIIIACGRYEGIDARVSEHYSSVGIEVLEYSLGDYVLNGGEVAAVALVEAVGRLLPGMVGNPESLVEESHGAAGLLEYPVYTRPQTWREQAIPPVLTSGDHGATARWRRDRAIEKTAARRPDMMRQLDSASLDKLDKRKLASLGWLVPAQADHPVPMNARVARAEDIAAVAELAAATFPDAAPDYLSDVSIQAFIAENLTPDTFTTYIHSPDWLTMVLVDPCGRIVGYTLSLVPESDGVAGRDEGAPVDAVVGNKARKGPLVELSKFYIAKAWRGSGASTMLFNATRVALLERTGEWEEPYLWLGTNARNKRAQKAYKGLGFERVGKRTFTVGEQDNSDVVFARLLRMA